MGRNRVKGAGVKVPPTSPKATPKSMRLGAPDIGDPEFEVVRILSQRTDACGEFYEVEWKGYSATTWEPRVNLTGCEKVLRAWHKKNRLENAKKPRKRSSSSPKGQKAPKKLKMGDGAQHDRDSIEELTSGAVTAGELLEIESKRISSPTYGSQLANTTPDHPETARFQAKLDLLSGPPVTLVNTTGDGERSPPLNFELLGSLRFADGIPDFDPGFNCGCECPASGCTDPKACACVEDVKPRQFAYKNDRVRTGRSNGDCIVECNRACACDMECGNRVVQRGRQIPLEIFRTSYKGWGLRCPKTLEAGTFIELYLGEVIGADEATLRAELGDVKGASYLFDLDKFSELPEYENLEIFTIDGEICGSVARFINHSCEPNLQTFAVLTDRTDRRIYNLALFTLRKVKAFEELTFSYSDADEEVGTDGLPKPRVETKWACKCGARSCRGYIWNH